MKDKFFLLAIAILTFILYDGATTIIVADYLGSWGYETSAVIRQAQDNFGMLGFMFVKIMLCMLCLSLLYLITGLQKQTEMLAHTLYLGFTITGLYAGTSNLNIILNGTSFYLLGLDAQKTCILILALSMVVGLSLTVNSWIRRGDNASRISFP